MLVFMTFIFVVLPLVWGLFYKSSNVKATCEASDPRPCWTDGFMYLVAVMDWWSRYVLAWELSNSLDSEFCIRAWNPALAGGRRPLIANTDQGGQFTSEAYLDAVESAGVDVSMDGRGRWMDNRCIERLWRSAKQEDIYVQDYGDGLTAQRGLTRWFGGYNTERPHQALEYATPGEWYHSPESYGAKPAAWRW